MTDEQREEITDKAKQALSMARDSIGRDLHDDETEMVIVAVLQHLGFPPPNQLMN